MKRYLRAAVACALILARVSMPALILVAVFAAITMGRQSMLPEPGPIHKNEAVLP